MWLNYSTLDKSCSAWTRTRNRCFLGSKCERKTTDCDVGLVDPNRRNIGLQKFRNKGSKAMVQLDSRTCSRVVNLKTVQWVEKQFCNTIGDLGIVGGIVSLGPQLWGHHLPKRRKTNYILLNLKEGLDRLGRGARYLVKELSIKRSESTDLTILSVNNKKQMVASFNCGSIK